MRQRRRNLEAVDRCSAPRSPHHPEYFTKGSAVLQICALPPSTNNSIPVTKLESSDARNSAALAISSASPIRPIGIVDTILAMVSGDCRATIGVSTGPGLTTLERMRRSFNSEVHVRTKERTAALDAA